MHDQPLVKMGSHRARHWSVSWRQKRCCRLRLFVWPPKRRCFPQWGELGKDMKQYRKYRDVGDDGRLRLYDWLKNSPFEWILLEYAALEEVRCSWWLLWLQVYSASIGRWEGRLEGACLQSCVHSLGLCSAKQIPCVPLRSHSLFEVCTEGKNVGSGETKEISAMCDFVAPTGMTNVSANPKDSRDGLDGCMIGLLAFGCHAVCGVVISQQSVTSLKQFVLMPLWEALYIR